MVTRYLLVLWLFLFALKANAQTCCTAGAPISSNLEISNGEKHSLLVQLSYEYKSINLLIDENKRLTNDPRSRFGQNLSLKLDYILSQKFAVSAIIPGVQQGRSTISQSQRSFGLGDVTLITQYAILSKPKSALNLAAGIKLPLGKVNHRDGSNIFLSPDMQSGSGSFDFIVRSSYNLTGFVFPLLSANASALYRKNGLNDSFGSTENFGGRSFGFGDNAIFVFGLKYLLDYKQGFLIPDLAIKYRWGSANREETTLAPNSGGHWLSIPFGLSYDLDGTKTIRFYSELPVYQKLKGLQITTDFIVGLQLSYLIKTKNSDQLIKY